MRSSMKSAIFICGKCRKNRIDCGILLFGTNCIGCLSCVQYCPNQAINIGSITKHRKRYHNANIKATGLMEKIYHID